MNRESSTTWAITGLLLRASLLAAVSLLAGCVTHQIESRAPVVTTEPVQRDIDESFKAVDSASRHSSAASGHLDKTNAALSRIEAKEEVILKYWDTAK